MVVDVIWVTNHPGTVIPRFYWDQGILEALFDHSLWRPVGASTFRHHDGFDMVPHPIDGAVVVVPARHHAGPDDIAWLNENIARLEWCLLILTGDEESAFPLCDVEHPRMIAWWMSGRPDRQRGTPRRLLGSGWPPQARLLLAENRDLAMDRPLDYFFAGQVTHQRRTECATAIKRLLGKGQLVETKSFTSGLPHDEYYAGMASAKIVPCPSGPVSPDSFRVYEALEAGCLPLADRFAPSGSVPGYWPNVLPGVPIPLWADWEVLPVKMPGLLDAWPANANKVFAAWQGYRRNLAYALESDIQELTGAGWSKVENLADLLTIVIPTSPIPSHPGTAIIDETIASVRAYPELEDCEMLILIDGVRREQEHRRGDYEEYVRRLLWDCLHDRRQTLPIRFEEHHHQVAMMREALEKVRTPLVLFVEHDTPTHNDVPWDGICQAVLAGDVDFVRLHHESFILAPHEHLMIDREPIKVGPTGVPVLRTAQWSQRPHIASTDFYRRVLSDFVRPDARSMIEDAVYGPVLSAWLDDGMAGWNRYKLAIYAPEGDMKRSWHLDGRAGEDKYEMHFGTPEPEVVAE